MAKILVIDDEEYIRGVLTINAKGLGHEAESAATLSEGLRWLGKDAYDLVFLDVLLPDGNGLEVLPKIKGMAHDPEVIIITGMGESQGAELAINSGAWDYIEKPFARKEIILQINRALAFRSSKTKSGRVSLKRDGIIGSSIEFTQCLDQIAWCCGSDVNVLLSGETGTGKELLARMVHENSKRSAGPFVVVDCTVLPENLIESMLFGHVKGAFTGAESQQEGLVQQAQGGTLFLDEVGEMGLSAQKRFLRVLQERRFRPVGGSREIESDFRLISATNKDLDAMVQGERFRNDLLFRLRTFHIQVPPLRRRKADIKQLFQHYLYNLCQTHSTIIKGFVPEFLEMLAAYDWPGNIRELINMLEKVILSDPENPTLYPFHLPKEIRIQYTRAGLSKKDQKEATSDIKQSEDIKRTDFPDISIDPTLPLKEFRDKIINDYEIWYLKRLMATAGKNMKKACQISRLSPSRLYTLLRKHDI